MRRRGLWSAAKRGDQPLKQPSPGRVAKKSVELTALPAGSMKKDSRGRKLGVAKEFKSSSTTLDMLQGRCVHKESESRLAMVG